MQQVRIIGWNRGLEKISLTKLLQESTGRNLAESKAIVDGLLEGKSFEISFDDEASAKVFSEKAIRLGARVE